MSHGIMREAKPWPEETVNLQIDGEVNTRWYVSKNKDVSKAARKNAESEDANFESSYLRCLSFLISI